MEGNRREKIEMMKRAAAAADVDAPSTVAVSVSPASSSFDGEKGDTGSEGVRREAGKSARNP